MFQRRLGFHFRINATAVLTGDRADRRRFKAGRRCWAASEIVFEIAGFCRNRVN